MASLLAKDYYWLPSMAIDDGENMEVSHAQMIFVIKIFSTILSCIIREISRLSKTNNINNNYLVQNK